MLYIILIVNTCIKVKTNYSPVGSNTNARTCSTPVVSPKTTATMAPIIGRRVKWPYIDLIGPGRFLQHLHFSHTLAHKKRD
jgi:hypothetical protein